MSGEMSDQRLAEIRRWAEQVGTPWANTDIRDLLGHIDALTAQRDEARRKYCKDMARNLRMGPADIAASEGWGYLYTKGGESERCGQAVRYRRITTYVAGRWVVDSYIACTETSHSEDPDTEPDWTTRCEVCGDVPTVPITEMCGPCTFGEADTAGGNW